MKKDSFIYKMLSESGEISLMRVMALYSVIVSSMIALYGIYSNKDLTDVAALAGVFLGTAFAGKAGQKYMEKK